MKSSEPNAPREGRTPDRLRAASVADGQPSTATGGARRTLILHYHMFKNAGTSIDEMLKQNFGSRWGSHEFAGAGARHSNVEVVAQYLREHPGLVAFSSHTALLPAPAIKGVIVFPIIFIRHPIDRLYSAYLFERTQRADTAGARLAKEHDFPGYLRALLKSPRLRQARNFQTARLAMNNARSEGTDLDRALRTLDELPFVGLVEEYEKSVNRLAELLRPTIPDFQAVIMRKNVSRAANDTLRERRSEIRKVLGKEFFAELRHANADDIEVFRNVKARYA